MEESTPDWDWSHPSSVSTQPGETAEEILFHKLLEISKKGERTNIVVALPREVGAQKMIMIIMMMITPISASMPGIRTSSRAAMASSPGSSIT